MITFRFAALAVVPLLACACAKNDDDARSANDTASPAINDDGEIVVFTTFYPTKYFTERIVGDLAEVVCPVPADADAIFWQPDDATIARYQQADVIVVNGASFEKWVAHATLPESRVVETAVPFADEFITFANAIVHRHGPEGEHSHEGVDGHTWVDPVNAKAQAGVILAELVRRWPEHKDAFTTGYEKLAADLDTLDSGFRDLADRAAEVPLLTSHPAYNYIARRYGWKIRNLDLDPGSMPDAQTFAGIRRILADFPAETLLWEGAPDPAIAARFESELGLASEVFSPCELRDPGSDDDYMDVMTRNLATMRRVFQ